MAVITPTNFNWQTYVQLNPDLTAAGIDTEAEARQHYAEFGWLENRPGVTGATPAAFDPNSYDLTNEGAGFRRLNQLTNLGASRQQIIDEMKAANLIGDRMQQLFPELRGLDTAYRQSIGMPEYQVNTTGLTPEQLASFDVSTGIGLGKLEELLNMGATPEQILQIAGKAPVVGSRFQQIFPTPVSFMGWPGSASTPAPASTLGTVVQASNDQARLNQVPISTFIAQQQPQAQPRRPFESAVSQQDLDAFIQSQLAKAQQAQVPVDYTQRLAPSSTIPVAPTEQAPAGFAQGGEVDSFIRGTLAKKFADGGPAGSPSSGVRRLEMSGYQDGGEVTDDAFIQEMMTGTLSEAQGPSPVDTAVSDFISSRSKLFTDPKQFLDKTYENIKQEYGDINKDPKAMEAFLMDNLGFGGLTAYHGGPKLFKQFDPSKRGTGEGFQQYGVGSGYAAEARPVAEGYRRYLGGDSGIRVGNKKLETFQKTLRKELDQAQTAKDQMMVHDKADLLTMVTSSKPSLFGRKSEEMSPQEILKEVKSGRTRQYDPRAVEWLESTVIPNLKYPGYLYKGDIPDEIIPTFLDWDKPLSQQTKEVRGVLEKDPIFQEVQDPRKWSEYSGGFIQMNLFKDSQPGKNISGEDLYKFLSLKLESDQAATDYLDKLGLRGIRYLDEYSRGKEKGTSNFVVFRPEDYKVEEINDLPLEEWIKQGKIPRKANGGEISNDEYIQQMMTGTPPSEEKLQSVGEYLKGAYKENIPVHARVYLETLLGKRDPITAEDFTKEELSRIDNLVQKTEAERLRKITEKQSGLQSSLDKTIKRLNPSKDIANKMVQDPDWVAYGELNKKPASPEIAKEQFKAYERFFNKFVDQAPISESIVTIIGEPDPKKVQSYLDENKQKSEWVPAHLRDRLLKVNQTLDAVQGKGIKGAVDDYGAYGSTSPEKMQDTDISRTLGRFNYETLPSGRRVIKDTYDFYNEYRAPVVEQYEKMGPAKKALSVLLETIKDPGQLPSILGNAYIGRDGRPVEIEYDPKDLPVKREAGSPPQGEMSDDAAMMEMFTGTLPTDQGTNPGILPPELREAIDVPLDLGNLLIRGTAGAVAGPVYGLYKGLTSDKFGTKEGVAEARSEAERMMGEITGEPKTQAAKDIMQFVGEKLEAAKIPPMPQFLTTPVPGPGSASALMRSYELAETPPTGTVKLADKGAKPVATPPTDPLGFYSPTEKVVMNLPQEKGTAQQMLAQISKAQGVKPVELRATGLEDYLKSRGNEPVTKQEIQDFLRNNPVQVDEVMLGKGQVISPEAKQRMQAAENRMMEIDNDLGDYFTSLPFFPTDLFYRLRGPVARKAVAGDAEAMTELDEMELPPKIKQLALEYGEQKNEYLKYSKQAKRMEKPKFDRYNIPGGENAREIYLTLPFRESGTPEGYKVTSVQYDDGTYRYFAETPTTRSAAYKTEQEANAELQRKTEALKDFRKNVGTLFTVPSVHSVSPEADKNRLAHIFLDDRTDAEGNKVLFVQELQSDWAQQGRDQGFEIKPTPWEDPAYKSARARTTDLLDEFNINNADPARQAEIRPLLDEAIEIQQSFEGKKGPSRAPFVTNTEDWLNLALKRVIKEAVDSGADNVAFIKGEQAAEKYSLNTVLDSIEVMPLLDNRLVDLKRKGGGAIELTVDNDGKVVQVDDERFFGQFANKPLSEIIGKEMAEKAMAVKSSKGKESVEFSAEDMVVGGEGMKGFYDNILPKTAEKLLKRLGGGKIEPIAMKKRDTGGMSGYEAMDRVGIPEDQQEMHWIRLTQEERDNLIERARNTSPTYLGFKITPEMREMVQKEGLPKFAAGGEVTDFIKRAA